MITVTAIPVGEDADTVVRRVREGLMDPDATCCRVQCATQALAEQVVARLTPLERRLTLVSWADYPEWDLDEETGEWIEQTQTVLVRQ